MSATPETEAYLRHIRACRNAVLPGGRVAFRIGGTQVGWVAPRLAAALRADTAVISTPEGLDLRDAEDLARLNHDLVAQGHFRWRREAFDVRAHLDGPVLATLDRGALPGFGVFAVGVHVNGLVRRPDGLHLWVGRRAADKALDPGKLDHLVAGGVPAGLTPAETLIKEAGEEAAIPPDIAATARLAGHVSYAMERPEGLRRDHLYCYDLELPADFRPRPADGEVESFALWPVARVLAALRETDDFKFNVPLVLIDFAIRHGLIAGVAAQALRQALEAGALEAG